MNRQISIRIYLILLLAPGCLLTVSGQKLTSGKSYIHVNTKEAKEITDNNPPSVSLLKPELIEEEKYTTHEEKITVIGQVEDESGIRSLFVNAEPVSLSEENIFTTTVQLEVGDNDLNIIAIDKIGNYRELKFAVHYTPEITFRALAAEGKYYALIIGNNQYDDPAIHDLDNAVADATSLQKVLVSGYTFDQENVTLLKNATREQIINELDELSYQITPNDNLLIFYAGHGWWDEEANIGYWLPTDARQTSKAAWFRNSTLCDYLKEIKSKHTLLVADACFGGSIFKTRSVFNDAPKAINKLYELPSRKAMTSGTLTEVPDRSAFARFLIERLENNTEKYLPSEQLFSSFRIAVINNSNVIPQYGEIRNVGDEGGDFIFIRK
jgi:hypothetical protein